ncbi:MAG: FHA domain-containing protein [Burkholderiales bacterium]|nr:FHA domain-containing protein [Burkholderiales bacterium]
MAKLILTLDNTLVREVPLDKERIMIGRKPSNEIQIENLAVSGEHACIVTILNDSFLEDMGSTNGTLVNGQPIKKHILQNNDVIEIGKYKLKYVAGAPAQAAPAEDFEKTMILRPAAKAAAMAKPAAAPAAPAPAAAPAAAAPAAKPSMPPPTPKPVVPGAAPAATPAAAPAAAAPAAVAAAAAKPGEGQQLAAVQILSGPSAGRELDLVKNLTTLGKPGVQVAVITKRPQGYFITHVEGAKFPVVNGKTIDAQAQPLRDHDVIELAGVKMEFFIKK